MNRFVYAPLALALPLGVLAASPAQAADTWVFQGNLGQLNDSGTTGQAWVEVEGNQAHITLDVSGAVAGAPHAQHIHIGGGGVCPTGDADGNGDGTVSTVEGQPDYGQIAVSLTTEGGTGADSGLAVERFPAEGEYTYERTIELTDDQIQGLSDGQASVIVHGVDTNGDGEYSGEAMSELNPELPLEATAPAACGELALAPDGGMETGRGALAADGPATEGPDAGLVALGGGLVVGAAATGVLVTRRLRSNS